MLLQRQLAQGKPFWCLGQQKFFFSSCLVCRLYRLPTISRREYSPFLLGIMPTTDNQQAERQLFITCCWIAWYRCVFFISAVSHTLFGWMISFCTDSFHFVKNHSDIERIHHFTLPCQILAMSKQVLRYAGYSENQDTCRRRWIVGLTHCILWMCSCTLQEPNTVLMKQCRGLGGNKGKRSGKCV